MVACTGAAPVSNSGGPAPALSALNVTLAADSLRVGELLSARAAGVDARGRSVGAGVVAWASSTPGVATVSDAGVVSAVAVGSTTISASAGGVRGSAALRVIAAALPGSRLSISPAEGALTVGHTIQLYATLIDPGGVEIDGRAVTWSASPATVASVSPDGVVTARKPGSAIIVAAAEGLSASAPVTVTAVFDAGIVVAIAAPAAGQLVADTLSVVASAQPDLGASATAVVSSHQAALSLQPVGPLGNGLAWAGKVDLSDLRFGLYYVVVTVTDARGVQGVDSVLFERDPLKIGGGGVTGPPRLKSRRPAPPPLVLPRPRPGGA